MHVSCFFATSKDVSLSRLTSGSRSHLSFACAEADWVFGLIAGLHFERWCSGLIAPNSWLWLKGVHCYFGRYWVIEWVHTCSVFCFFGFEFCSLHFPAACFELSVVSRSLAESVFRASVADNSARVISRQESGTWQIDCLFDFDCFFCFFCFSDCSFWSFLLVCCSSCLPACWITTGLDYALSLFWNVSDGRARGTQLGQLPSASSSLLW